MTKQRRRKIVLPAKRIGRSETLYVQPVGATLVPVVLLIVMFAFGVRLLVQKQYSISSIPFSVGGMLAYGSLTRIQKVHILEDTLYVEYLTATVTYKAHEIESVEWKSIPVMHRGSYTWRLMLFIEIRNGKKIQIPPPGEYDLQKSLLQWRDKYQRPGLVNVIVDK